MRRWTTAALAVACLAAFVFAPVDAATREAVGDPTVSAEEEAIRIQDVPTGWSAFNPFNDCRPVPVTVTASGLSRNVVRTAAESRLRAARLYSDEGDHAASGGAYLRILVDGIDAPRIEVSLNYMRTLFNPASSTKGLATTLHHAGNIAPVNDRGSGAYVASDLARKLDWFIAEYLRENDSACNVRGGQMSHNSHPASFRFFVKGDAERNWRWKAREVLSRRTGGRCTVAGG